MRYLGLLFSLFLVLMITPVFGQDVPVSDVVVVEEEAASLGSVILMGVIGVLIYFITKVSQALPVFDFTYWWKDNRISFLVSLLGVILLSVLNSNGSGLLDTVLGLLGITLDTTTGSIGSITFGTFFAGVVYEIVKKWRGKGRVLTDGSGNVLEVGENKEDSL